LLLAVNRICASCGEQQEIISRNFGLLVNLQELVVKKKKQQRRLAMAMASILATDLTRCCICYTSAIASASSSLPTRSRLISAEKKQKKTKKKLLNNGKLLQSVSKEWRWKNNPDPLVVAPAAVAAASGSPLQEGGVARRSSTREETSVSLEEETSSNDVQESAVRGVLFDMDGVLCDSEHCSREAGVALFAEMSISVTAEDFVPFMGTGRSPVLLLHSCKISSLLQQLCYLSLSLLRFSHCK
jgi:hypothetical protein